MKAIVAVVALSFLSVEAATSEKLKLNQQRPLYGNFSSRAQGTTKVDQRLICYDRRDCSGNSVNIGVVNVPDLSYGPYYFDNKIVSCSYRGIYLLYDGYNYNADNLQGGAFGEAWGEDRCVNMEAFSNKASSVRFTGAPNGYKYDTLNFYEGEYYNGYEQYYYDDSSRAPTDNFGRSMIITGCSPWTLYEYDNYSGLRVCFYPSDTQNCYPSFFRNPDAMAGMANRVSSVKRGCFARKRIIGSPVPFDGNGQYFHQ